MGFDTRKQIPLRFCRTLSRGSGSEGVVVVDHGGNDAALVSHRPQLVISRPRAPRPARGRR